eukprot:COSAG01_NODE_32_length_35644_cov_22.273738_5_plen_83_part_00
MGSIDEHERAIEALRAEYEAKVEVVRASELSVAERERVVCSSSVLASSHQQRLCNVAAAAEHTRMSMTCERVVSRCACAGAS